MLYVSFALSQGALALSQGAYPYSKSKDTTIDRITKGFFGFWGRFRVKPGMRKGGSGMRKGGPGMRERRFLRPEGDRNDIIDRQSNNPFFYNYEIP